MIYSSFLNTPLSWFTVRTLRFLGGTEEIHVCKIICSRHYFAQYNAYIKSYNLNFMGNFNILFQADNYSEDIRIYHKHFLLIQGYKRTFLHVLLSFHTGNSDRSASADNDITWLKRKKSISRSSIASSFFLLWSISCIYSPIFFPRRKILAREITRSHWIRRISTLVRWRTTSLIFTILRGNVMPPKGSLTP
jgi:hypothetical protein